MSLFHLGSGSAVEEVQPALTFKSVSPCPSQAAREDLHRYREALFPPLFLSDNRVLKLTSTGPLAGAVCYRLQIWRTASAAAALIAFHDRLPQEFPLMRSHHPVEALLLR